MFWTVVHLLLSNTGDTFKCVQQCVSSCLHCRVVADAHNSSKSQCLTCNGSSECQYVDASFSLSGQYYILACLGPDVPSYRLRHADGHLSQWQWFIVRYDKILGTYTHCTRVTVWQWRHSVHNSIRRYVGGGVLCDGSVTSYCVARWRSG